MQSSHNTFKRSALFRVKLPVNHIHVNSVLMTLDGILFACNMKKEVSPVLLCVSFDFIGVQSFLLSLQPINPEKENIARKDCC